MAWCDDLKPSKDIMKKLKLYNKKLKENLI